MVVINAILWVVCWAICIAFLIFMIALNFLWCLALIQVIWEFLLNFVRFFIPNKYLKNKTVVEDQPCSCGLPLDRNTEITIIIKKEN